MSLTLMMEMSLKLESIVISSQGEAERFWRML